MKARVYIETSIVSYLAARASRDVVTLANQQITIEWWQSTAPGYEMVISEFVVNEAGLGDPEAAARRLDFLRGMPRLATTAEVERLALLLCVRGALPPSARTDSFHIASAAVHGVEYLLTWNCTHIANGVKLPHIESLCREAGYSAPRICTPPQLMQE